MSFTQVHPESYLAKRIAEIEDGSATNPFTKSPIATGAVAVNESHQSNKADSAPEDGASEDEGSTHDEDTSRLRRLLTENISATARLILSPSPLLVDALTGQEDWLPVPGHRPGDFFAVSQSSKKPSFEITSGVLSLKMYYETGSDNLVLVNPGLSHVLLAPIEDGSTAITRIKVLKGLETDSCVVTPGPWKILYRKGRHLGDFLVQRRRYELTLRQSKRTEAGTTRTLESASESRKKRRLPEDQRLVKFDLAQNAESSTDITVTDDDYPLSKVKAGQIMTVKYPSGSHQGQGKGVEGRDNSDPTENYSLSFMRKIVNRDNSALFLSRHSHFGRIVVKMIRRREYHADLIPIVAKSFENEMKLMRQINHPSIVKFRGSDARLFSIFMDYLPYGDLASWAHAETSFFKGTAGNAKKILGDMASALDYLHEQSIFHSDIKPGNIIFDLSQGAFLIDFGNSCIGAKAETCGTPWYLPPEYLEGVGASAERDVFSLGVTMLYLLRKIPLPDKGENWIIFKARADGPDREKMRRWLDKVKMVRIGLDPNIGIEQLVMEMLNGNVKARISAAKIMDRIRDEKKSIIRHVSNSEKASAVAEE